MIRKVAILANGGDVSGFNAVIRAIVKTAENNGIDCYGFIDGYNGLLKNNYEKLSTANDEHASGILQKGGSIIGSSTNANVFHYKVEENGETVYKALSDVCVTSSSAINILNNLDTDEVIFLPDRNLGSYLSEQIPNKNFTLYPGFCPTHERIEKDEILELKEKYPNYPVLVHPECNKSVRNLADYIGSTSELINYSASSNANGFIVVTEEGVFYEMKLKSPNKTFIPTKTGMICPNMKKISLNDLYNCLKNEEFEVNIDEELRFKAHKALENMHLLSV